MFIVKCLRTGRSVLTTLDRDEAARRAKSSITLGLFHNGLHID